MKQLLLVTLLAVVLAPLPGHSAAPSQTLSALGQTQTYTNNGTVHQPQIDAVNVVNYGIFIASVLQPFETFSTLNYTNTGIMEASVGFRFNYSSPTTPERKLAANFINMNPGVIEVLDPPFPTSPPDPCAVSPIDPSYLWIFATNIVNGAGTPGEGASLIAGANGEMRLVGTNVDLSYSGLEILPVWSLSEPHSETFFGNPVTGFEPDIAIYDTNWAQANFSQQNPLNSGALWVNGVASAQSAPAAPAGNATPGASPPFSFVPTLADSFINTLPQGSGIITLTNFTGSPTNVTGTNFVNIILITNMVKGAMFVAVPPEFTVQGGFSQGPNFFDQASTLISVGISNAVTGLDETNYISVTDTLGTGDRGIITNVIGCAPTTSRPLNYDVNRFPTLAGGPGNHGYPEADFFTSSSAIVGSTNISEDSVTNASLNVGTYAAYSAFFDNIVSRAKEIPAGTATNFPGRVRIFSDNLDLTETRIRGEGEIFVQSRNLVSSTNAVIDCENLRFDLDSSSGSLKVENLTKTSVSRVRGSINAWSAVWNNSASVVFTNNFVFTNSNPITNVDGTITSNTIAVQTPFTNTISIGFQVFMLDARGLQTVVPVNVYDLITHSPDVVVNDSMSLIQKLQIDGRSFTLNGSITIPGQYPLNPVTGNILPGTPLRDWTAGNAPRLIYFTNNGTLAIANEGHFGDDRPKYSTFVNSGTLSAGGITWNSVFFENKGTVFAQNALIMQGNFGTLHDGNSSSGTISQFTADNLKFQNYGVSAAGKLYFNVVTSLSDSGAGSGNVFNLQDGFFLQTKPQTGDLLGTSVLTTAPAVPSVKITHTWAGEDRGPSPAGFTNNVALGSLVLASLSPSPTFSFSGIGAHNGLYVDLLDLSLFTTPADLLNRLKISGNLTIYFAAARLGFTPPLNTNGIPQEPEEYLDGLFGGHLRWVPTFAGPNSSQTVLVGGQPMQVNKALFNSQIIDSDDDGVPNAFDGGPGIFQTAAVNVNVNGNGSVIPGSGSLVLLSNQVYSLVAVPGDGATFSGWSGSIESVSPVLTFTNTGDVDVTANFSFQLVPGTYNGLFFQSDGVQFQQSGSFTASARQNGSYSGSVQIGKQKFPFSGQVDESGHSVPSSSLAMDLQFGTDHITGTVGDGASWVADLVADRAVFDGKTNKAPFAGVYTVLFPGSGDTNDTEVPQGDGYGTVTVTTAGKLKLTGSLADGTKITQSATVSGEGHWPLYIPLYGGQGQLLGWLTFENIGASDIDGLVSWIKEPNATAKLYPDGFNFQTNAIGSVYNPTNKPATGFNSGSLLLSGGNLSQSLSNQVTISGNNAASVSGSNKKNALTIKATQGTFNGSLLDPVTGKAVKFNGVILQKQGFGSGYFLGTNQSGKVLLIGP